MRTIVLPRSATADAKSKRASANAAGSMDYIRATYQETFSKSDAGMESMRNLQRSVSAIEKGAKESARKLCIVDSFWFNTIITTTVVLNTIQLGLEADTRGNPDFQEVWRICENVVTAIFFLELNIKIFVLRCSYFNDKANWLDAVLTMMGVLDCWVLGLVAGDIIDLQSMSLLRVLRLVRLVRVAKIASRIRPLMLVLSGLYQALLTTFWVFLVLVIVMYVFAVFCTEYIGHGEKSLYTGFSTQEDVIDQQEVMLNFNPHIMFGSMAASMLTLFNIAIGSEWQEVVRPLAVKQPLFVALFLVYCILIVFGIMNVIIAIVVDNVIMESKKMDIEHVHKERTAKRKLLQEVQNILAHVDTNGDGEVDLEEFKAAFYADPELQALLNKCDLPAGWTPSELLTMLDNSGDGVLQKGEFTTNLFRLMDGDEFQKICIMQASLNQLKHLVRQAHEKLEIHMAELVGAIHQISPEQFPMSADYLRRDIHLDGEKDSPSSPKGLSRNLSKRSHTQPVSSSTNSWGLDNGAPKDQAYRAEESSWQELEASETPQRKQPNKASTVNDCALDLAARRVQQDLPARVEKTSASTPATDSNHGEQAGAQRGSPWQELGPDVKCIPYKRIADILDASVLAMKETFHREIALLTRCEETSPVSQKGKATNTALQARSINDSGQEFDGASNVFIGVPSSPRSGRSSSKLVPGIKPALPAYKDGIDGLEAPKFEL